MTKVVEDNQNTGASTKIINAKYVTTIANSRDEHCIYTYSTHVDSHFDIKSKEFFNPTYTFAKVGDIFRVFRFEDDDEIAMYYQFLVTKVDKIGKTVQAVAIFEKSIKKLVEGKE